MAYHSDESGRLEIHVVPFQARIVGGGGISNNKPQYAVSPDGRFLINVPGGDSSTAPITLLLNWKPSAK